MSWLKIDDEFAEHPKVDKLSDKAFRFHVAALCRCAKRLTDGRVSEKDVKILAIVVHAPTWKKYVNELVAAGLWIPQNHGWSIHDYLQYNPSSVRVREERERRAAEQRARRNTSRNAVRSKVRAEDVTAPRTRTPIYNVEPTTLVPRDVTSEVDAGQVIDFSSVLKDVS